MITFANCECVLMKINQHSFITSQHLVIQMQDRPGEICFLILQKCLESFCEALHIEMTTAVLQVGF